MSASSGAPGEAQRAIDELLAAARVALDMELTFLSHHADGEQLYEFVSNPGEHLPLQPGTRIPESEAYCALMLRGDVPNAVRDVQAEPLLDALSVTEELGVRAYCGVPVRLPDGTLYGTLCGLDSTAQPDLSEQQVTVLRVIAALVGEQLERAQQEQRAAAGRRDELMSLVAPGALEMVVQPITDVRGPRVVGYEALSRFCAPDGSRPRPDLVFAQAATYDLGSRFELTAIAAALDLLPHLPAEAYLSVNVSASTLALPAFADCLPPAVRSRIVLELTEHDAVEDYERTAAVLCDVRRDGVRLAIDDVGAGFASLRHILRLDPDVIKLDMSLTRGVDVDPPRRALCAALVGFTEQLGATLVAEGVETAQERDGLLDLGVHVMQGYLLGRPASVPRAGAGQG